MYESGIVDPTKVVRSCIQNSLSAASMLLTTECVVAEIKEENLILTGRNASNVLKERKALVLNRAFTLDTKIDTIINCANI